MKTVIARAHTNLALVKYWGKANEKLILPQTSSLSLTLDRFYTDTAVTFSKRFAKDQVMINHHASHHNLRVINFLNLIRQRAGLTDYAKVDSVNHVPTAAGLGSSASGFAALAAAAGRAAGLNLNRLRLSRLARRGSGSATRSIYGGWVKWQHGHSDRTSYAIPLRANPQLNDVRMIIMITKPTPKPISSRLGMRRCVHTSPYYPVWKQIVKQDLALATGALQAGNFTQLGQVAETNALRMHALTLSAKPPFTYFNGMTLRIMRAIKQLRQQGLECYSTLDAGPNVVIICQEPNVAKIKAHLSNRFHARIIVTGSGPGIQYLSPRKGRLDC